MTCTTQIRLRHVVRNTVAKSTGEPESFIGLEDIAGGAGRLVAQGVAEKAATDALVFEPGDVLFGKLRPYLAKSLAPTDRGTCTSELLVMRPGPRLDARFLLYLTLSEPWLDWAVTTSYGTKMPRTSWDAMADFAFTLPPLGEQRRIADFLDTETTRLDNVVQLRQRQVELLSERLALAVDDLGNGRISSLADGHSPVVELKAGHVIEVLPGYAFPSDEYSVDPSDVRLLRGVNVSVGSTVWDDAVYWPAERRREAQRFELRSGDVVLGMDRPWISGGMRIARVSKDDLPALLLQRVACLRPRSDAVSEDFIYWSYQAARFRLEIEAELTGVSIPHLSGPQIAGYRLLVPERAAQRAVVQHLEALSAGLRVASSGLDGFINLLHERRQALITAAVTGQVDVTTARAGRS